MEFYSSFNSKQAQDKTLEQVVEIIRSDEDLKTSTELHRSLLKAGKEEMADSVKESTPQVAVSFRMEGGKGKANCRECLYELLVDFDAKKPDERLPEAELERVKTILRTSYHAKLGYESISGLGYHIVVPFVLPEGIEIDLEADRKRGEEIFKRAHRVVNNMYAAWCGHKMDADCSNINRMVGLAHDPQVVCRPDARPFRLTREELGIDADGRLVKMRTPKQAVDQSGNRMALPLGDSLERAEKMLEEEGVVFESKNHHNYVMRLAFILNRMGVDEDEAAQALDDAYLGKMSDKPSRILHSCYKTASDEFGIWMPKRSANEVKTEIIANFLKEEHLRYDTMTQKTQQLQPNGRWEPLEERDENDLYIKCCSQSDLNLSVRLFLTVLNSSVVPEINPLKEYLGSLPAWTPEQPDFILQAAETVHMVSDAENQLWLSSFRKWFVAMVAGWMDDYVVNHQAIVLVGRQGIFKSTWINRLMPPALAAYTTDNIDLERLDKDEQLRAAEYGLINIDELDKLTDRQLNRIKSMVTTTHVDVRAAYGRHKEKRVRMASYAASGNKEEFLTDQTGNRRWLPFHVESIDSPYKTRLPYEGMYGQALYLLQNGFNYWFDLEEIDRLKEHVEEFMVPTSEEQLVPMLFQPVAKGGRGAEFLTLPEIAAKITVKGSLHRDVDLRRLGAVLTKQGFVKDRRGNQRVRGYYVYEYTTAEAEKLHDGRDQ